MFQRFSQGARDVVVDAQREAVASRQENVSSAHLLLALLRDGSTSADLVASCGVQIARLRAALSVRETSTDTTKTPIPFTPNAKKALELSLREALQLGDNHIDERHLLLALLKLDVGSASAALDSVAAERAEIRAAVLEKLEPAGGPARVQPGFRPGLSFRLSPEGTEVDVSELLLELTSQIRRLEGQVDRLTSVVERLKKGGET
jgi:ATP-dependent Clp protease ATP-binding subunit ClpC